MSEGVPELGHHVLIELVRLLNTTKGMSRSTACASRKSSKELWVGSLPAQITKAELKQHFSPYESAIKAVVLPPMRDGHSSHSKRYAFVVFHDEKSAIGAQSELNGTQLQEYVPS